MPRIPDVAIDGVFYLYHSVKDADEGKNVGGTGFFVSMPTPTPRFNYVYAVSNWHNAVDVGASVIRVNTFAGKPDIFDLGPEDWIFFPKKSDVAITAPLQIKDSVHKAAAIPRRLFVDDKLIAQKEIGVGEDVFMIGRFIDHDGGATNLPATRFGNISVMPTLVDHATGGNEPAYCIDMHSRTGFSGSPVFVYRMPGGNLNEAVRTGITQIASGFLYLLGIHFGQFPEEWPARTRGEEMTIDGLSGMTLVCPAAAIAELLDSPSLVQGRQEGDEMLRKKPQIIAETATDNTVKVRDGMLRTMLSTPPQPRKPTAPKRVKRK